jgi:hypothetical protein
LNLKAVLPQLQTLPILLAVGAAIIFAAPQDRAKARHPAYLRAQSAGRLQFEDPHSASTIKMRSAPQRAELLPLDRFRGPFPLPHPFKCSDAIDDRAAIPNAKPPPGPRASGEAPCRNTESPCYASNPAPQRQRQILYDRRGGGTSPRRDTYGPQVDRGRPERAPKKPAVDDDSGLCSSAANSRRSRPPGLRFVGGFRTDQEEHISTLRKAKQYLECAKFVIDL